ncbi:MAG: biotin synthase, partial [Imperialibacter sp.]
MTELRNNWTRGEIDEIYNSPMLDLIYRAATVHREYSDPQEVQVCTLLSVKTGGCPEDCSYCPQAARYHTDVKVQKLMDVDEVLSNAKAAKENGSTRFCMGAAWREVRDNKDFDKVIEMVKGVNQIG